MHLLSGNFLADPAGIIDGTQVIEDELQDALDALDARELISDVGALIGRLARGALTPDGVELGPGRWCWAWLFWPYEVLNECRSACRSPSCGSRLLG
jgi:hypothetical protein